MGSSNIATEERAMTITAEVKAQAPILGLINTDLKSEFGAASGDTVGALIPGYGEVAEGVELKGTAADRQLSIQKVPLTVSPKNIAASYDFVDASVRLGNFDQKVAKPYGAHLASHVRKEVFATILGGATRQFVLDNIANLKFGRIGKIIAAIEDSNMGGQINCVLSNRMTAALTDSGLNQFQNGSVAFQLWQGVIKNFDGADFVSQSEVIKFKAPNITGGTVVTPPSEGGEVITVKFSNISTVTEIPAGYVFTVAGVNSVDIFKKDDGYDRAFVVTKPTQTTADGTAALNISPIWATVSALKNATALPAANAQIGIVLSAGKTYHTGAVFDQNSIGYASAAIKEAPATDSAVSTIDGYVNVRMTAQFNIETGQNTVRFDILTGGKTLYGQGVAGLWVAVE